MTGTVKMNINKDRKRNKVSHKKTRGYRLKPETHLLISKIQKILGSDQDKAIACACNMYYAELSKGRAHKKPE